VCHSCRVSRLRLVSLLALVAALLSPASALARFGGGVGHFGGGGGGGFGGRGFGGRGFGGRGIGFPHVFFFGGGGGGGGFFSFILTLIVLFVLFRVGLALYRSYRARQEGGSEGPGGFGGSQLMGGRSPTSYTGADWQVASLTGRRELRRAQEARRQAELAEADDDYWDPDQLEARTRDCFLAVQEAWRQRDATGARPYVSDALYARIGLQLDGMVRQGRFDRVEDLRLEGAQLVRIHNVTNDAEDRFVVHLRGVARDWVEDARGMLVDGSEELEPFTEFWSFARDSRYGWVVDEVQQESEGAYHLKTPDVNRDEGPAVYER